MARNELFIKRNLKVRARFEELSRKNSKWRFDAIVEEIAGEFFLTKRTIEAIVRKEGTYKI